MLCLPQVTREALVDKYSPVNLRTEVKSDPSNRDCLVRLHFGKRRERPSHSPKFSAPRRSEDIGYDVDGLAANMANALAVMHWHVGIGANDVEFVLGSAPTRTTFPAVVPLTPAENFKHRTVHLWMLDFDRCKDMSLDKKGVEQAVAAFLTNDPYYLRPHIKNLQDQNLWAVFRDRYLKTSDASPLPTRSKTRATRALKGSSKAIQV
ncbi:Zinc finger domain containing protein [Elaphomyces granulatus]